MKKQYIEVTADYNDGDYTTKKTEITNEELQRIEPIIEAIKNFKPYQTPYPWDTSRMGTHNNNFPLGECLREDMGEKSIYEIYSQIPKEELDYFEEMYVPYGEYGIHTIESIDVVYEGKKLL